MARIEFYEGSEPGILTAIEDGAVPREGEFVSIRKVTWVVKRVTWAVDHADDLASLRKLRANVELQKPEEE